MSDVDLLRLEKKLTERFRRLEDRVGRLEDALLLALAPHLEDIRHERNMTIGEVVRHARQRPQDFEYDSNEGVRWKDP